MTRRRVLAALLLLACAVANAARTAVYVTTPTMCMDGTIIQSLTSVQVTWGNCVNGAIGTVQGSVTVPNTVLGAVVTVNISPTNLPTACAVAYVWGECDGDTTPTQSPPTNVLEFSPIPVLGKPTTLGQPISLPPSSSSSSSSSSSTTTK